MTRCLYLVERLVRVGDTFEPEARCAWGIRSCDGCPIAQMNIPRHVEIQRVERVSAACLDCPERAAECAECHRDPLMERALARQAWVIILSETDAALDERMAAERQASAAAMIF